MPRPRSKCAGSKKRYCKRKSRCTWKKSKGCRVKKSYKRSSRSRSKRRRSACLKKGSQKFSRGELQTLRVAYSIMKALGRPIE